MHGNGSELGHDGELAPDIQFMKELGFRCNAHVVAVEYPGYGISNTGGEASEFSVKRDVEIVFRFITSPVGADWPAERVVAFGRSIGTGPAAWLAGQYLLGACVLVSPYTSIRGMVAAVASEKLAWVISDRFTSIEEVKKSGFPNLLVYHGTRDEVIPFEHGDQIATTSLLSGHPHETRLVTLEGYGHNDVLNPYDAPHLELVCSEFVQFCAQSGALQEPLDKRLRVSDELFLPIYESPHEQQGGTMASQIGRIARVSAALSAQSLEASSATLSSGRF